MTDEKHVPKTGGEQEPASSTPGPSSVDATAATTHEEPARSKFTAWVKRLATLPPENAHPDYLGEATYIGRLVGDPWLSQDVNLMVAILERKEPPSDK